MILLFTLLDNKYNIIVDSLMGYWPIAVTVLLFVIVIAIPQIRDGIKEILRIFKKKEFKIKHHNETITFEVKKRSKDFDIVKIFATTHSYGVTAEYKWIEKEYPKYYSNIQFLCRIDVGNGKDVVFDKIHISKSKKGKTSSKTIWFDVTDFINGAGVPFLDNSDEYAEKIIRKMYS